MAAFLNAIMGDIASRVAAFLMDKSSKVMAPTVEDLRLHDLQRLLLRVQVIVEEVEGRHITNPLIAYQLCILYASELQQLSFFPEPQWQHCVSFVYLTKQPSVDTQVS